MGGWRKGEKKEGLPSKSDRSVADSAASAGMGMACTRVVERVCASAGLAGEAPTRFESAVDVTNGGVLWALPALLENGLVRHTQAHFALPAGFYSLVHVFVLLGFMALARVRTLEQLRYEASGEWGKLVGLDRIPEVRTLRKKLKHLSADREQVGRWCSDLSREWMESDPSVAGWLYVDGRVRVYTGSRTKLPRRYVSRERLCLRGTMDYWVNDQLGRPFFVVTTPFSDGLVKMLETEIVPRLEQEVPNQPSQEELDEDPWRSRFLLIFDREGYSPDFFRRMWERRIACVTYNKFPKATWSGEEFREQEVILAHGARVAMKLAERGARMSNGLWVREIRKLSKSGHQVSVLTTDFRSSAAHVAAHMFNRWSQENFFKYMLANFDLDRLADYEIEAADETRKVVNPAYRRLESEIRTSVAKLVRRRAEFGQLRLDEQLDPKAVARYEAKTAELRETIEQLEAQVNDLKRKRKATRKHIALGELAEEERFAQLAPARKQLVDTIRMIAYRAETAMAIVLRDVLARTDDTRPLLREIFTTEADLIPDADARTLTVRLHHLTNRLSDQAASYLAQQLNETQTIYPGTDLRMVFQLVSDLDATADPSTPEFSACAEQ